MSAPVPDGSPWVADRLEVTKSALYVYAAFEATVAATGEEWGRTATELGRLILWCAGQGDDAGMVGASRRMSGHLTSGARGRTRQVMDVNYAGAWGDPEFPLNGSRFVELEIAEGVRWACDAASLCRRQETEFARRSETTKGRWVQAIPPDWVQSKEGELVLRRRLFLAVAVARATMAASYLATDPKTVAVDLWARSTETLEKASETDLLNRCETMRDRLPARRARDEGRT